MIAISAMTCVCPCSGESELADFERQQAEDASGSPISSPKVASTTILALNDKDAPSASPTKKRVLVRMDTTPSPKKVVQLEINFLPLPATMTCWFDHVQNVPMMMDSPGLEKHIADDVCHEAGMICGLWQAGPHHWYKWQSDITVTAFMEANGIIEEEETEPAAPAPKKRSSGVAKKPAANIVAKKPAGDQSHEDFEKALKDLPIPERTKLLFWVEEMVNFENSDHGLSLTRDANYVRSRVYHKLRVKLFQANLDKQTFLSSLVKRVMGRVRRID